MAIMDSRIRADAIGRLHDTIGLLDSHEHPFLYFLPDLLSRPEFANLNPLHAVEFARLARLHEQPPVIHDALTILDRMVDPDSGAILPLDKEVYVDHNSFSWSELGDNPTSKDIIFHIFNKCAFLFSLGKG